MSWNRIILFFITVFFFHTGAVQAKELRVISEDELIIQGLLYEEYRAFNRSRVVFGRLYDTTGAKVYLFKEMTAALFSKTNINESIERLKIWDEKYPDTPDFAGALDTGGSTPAAYANSVRHHRTPTIKWLYTNSDDPYGAFELIDTVGTNDPRLDKRKKV